MHRGALLIRGQGSSVISHKNVVTLILWSGIALKEPVEYHKITNLGVKLRLIIGGENSETYKPTRMD